VPDPSEAQVLAGYLFQPGVTLSADASGSGMLVVNPTHQTLLAVAQQEPERTRRYLTLLYQRLFAQPVNVDTPENKQRAQQLRILGGIVGRQYSIYAPDLAIPVQSFLLQLQRQLATDTGTDSANDKSREPDANETTKPLTAEDRYRKYLDELLQAAEKEPNHLFRDVAYSRAVVATNANDYERAKQIAQKIDDNDLRADATSFALYRAALYLVDKGDLTKAGDLAGAIRDSTRQAVAKIAIAQKLVSSTQNSTSESELRLHVVELMSDVQRLFKSADSSVNGARILLARAALLAQVDANQALAGLADAVHMINQLESFDLRAGGAPRLGLSTVPASSATVINPKIGFDFHSAVDGLISTDFEQVAAVAGTFSARELNGLARVEVAKLYLLKNGKSKPKAAAAINH
jgi:hypothetical protein